MLVLHGFTMNGSIMRSGPADLWSRLAAHVDLRFPDGPLTCTQSTVDRLYSHMGTPPLPPPHHAWWDATSDGRVYRGWEESVALVGDLVTKYSQDGRCGILGFSQGAIFAAAVAALSARGQFPSLSFVVLVAGSVPRSELLAPFFAETIHVPSLHVWGEADPFSAAAPILAERFDAATRETVSWPGEHRVPTRGPGAEKIVDFVRRHSEAA